MTLSTYPLFSIEVKMCATVPLSHHTLLALWCFSTVTTLPMFLLYPFGDMKIIHIHFFNLLAPEFYI